MKNNTIKYFIYARKSSESDERQVQSIDDQVRIMEDIAKRYSLKVVGVFSESKSAKTPYKRAAFTKMIARIEAGEASGILCWKLDRLARNPDEAGRILGLLQRAEVEHIKTSEKDYYPGDNALISYLEFGMADQYSRDLSKNVKRGLQSKLDKGLMSGIAPLGWLNTKTENRGKNYMVVDPDRFTLLQKAWGLMLTGKHTPDEILDTLNNEWGFRTRPTKRRGGKPMSRSTIYRMFTNPFYCGLPVRNSKVYEGKHEPMVTVNEYDKVQLILGKNGSPRPDRHKYAYNGVICCGECGGFISATYKEKLIKSTGERKVYTLYYCVNARKNPSTCSQSFYTNVELVEDIIHEEIASFTILPVFKDWAVDILKREHTSEVTERTAIYERQQRLVNDTQRQLDNLVQMRMQDDIDSDTFRTEKLKLTNEQTRLRALMRETENRADHWIERAEKEFEFACTAATAFNTGDEARRRSILSDLGLNWTLKDKKLSITAVPWLVTIKNRYPAIHAKIEAFELEKTQWNERQKEAFASLSPDLRGRRDLNPQPPP